MAQAPPSDNLFIGDLPSDITMEACEAVFQGYGTVTSCRLFPPRQPGGPSAALVRFASVEEATWVVENLNGNLAEGLDTPIVVRFSNSQGSKGGKGGKGGGGGAWAGFPADSSAAQGGEPPASDNVFIGDLPEDFTQEQCMTVFANYGSVTSCRVNPPKMAGKQASALVRFASVDEATWVVANLNGNLADGLMTPIVARFANAAGAGGGGKGWGGNRAEPYPTGGKAGGKDGGKKGGGNGSFFALFGAVKKSGVLGGGHVPNECQAYVRNLPKDTTDLDLYRLFSPFGALAPSGAKAMTNPDGSCKGFAFVDFADAASVQAAIAGLNNFPTSEGQALAVTAKTGGGKGGNGAKGGKGWGKDAA